MQGRQQQPVAHSGFGSRSSRWARETDAEAPPADAPPSVQPATSLEPAERRKGPSKKAAVPSSQVEPVQTAIAKLQITEQTKTPAEQTVMPTDQTAMPTEQTVKQLAGPKKLDWAAQDDDGDDVLEIPSWSPVLERPKPPSAELAPAPPPVRPAMDLPAAVVPQRDPSPPEHVVTPDQSPSKTSMAQRHADGPRASPARRAVQPSAAFGRLSSGLLTQGGNADRTSLRR